ncbi:hypothetical protein GJ688_19410 [Heliobacillus mobilis]|uniref:Chemotaxis methyl-accepting receptor HlyB-like 4HB MCP domain-containing protein n=2 Tax=Heliobacterium mobile TaxID=28064 RepID=A0A6I3SSZ5_HELMO|nr:hypothetical protein [Heliobacterium mobile]
MKGKAQGLAMPILPVLCSFQNKGLCRILSNRFLINAIEKGEFLMSLRQKLLAGFLSIILLMFVTSTVAIWKMADMGLAAQEIQDSSVPSLEDGGWLNGAVSDIPRIVLMISLETDPQKMNKIETEQLNPLLSKINTHLAQYRDKYVTNEEEIKLYNSFMKDWSTYLGKLPSIIEAGKANQFDLANQRIIEIQPTCISVRLRH